MVLRGRDSAGPSRAVLRFRELWGRGCSSGEAETASLLTLLLLGGMSGLCWDPSTQLGPLQCGHQTFYMEAQGSHREGSKKPECKLQGCLLSDIT